MRNICLVLAYDGTDFHGWQRQPNQPTIQECVENAIERATGQQARVYGSGRTDAGVHAMNQFANFRSDSPIPCANLIKALNDVLPPSVRVKEAKEVDDHFHARYQVRSKTYRYRILLAPVCSPFLWRFVCHHPFPLDVSAMAEAARRFEGVHDFTSFAAVEAGSPAAEEVTENSEPRTQDFRVAGGGMVREIYSSRFVQRRRTSMLIYEVRGNGFLHHMVRNIVGTLLEVGRGRLAPTDMERILQARDRTLAGPTAPARGLCLAKVEY